MYTTVCVLFLASGVEVISFHPSEANNLYEYALGSPLTITCLINSIPSETTEWVTLSGDILDNSSYFNLSQLILGRHSITCREVNTNVSTNILVIIYGKFQ